MTWRMAALLAALTATLAAGIISVRYANERAGILEACGAVEVDDWPSALQLTEDLPFSGAAEREAAECRCFALLARGRGAECESLMERLLEDPRAENWAPTPRLAVHLIQTHRSAGRTERAAALARRAARLYPDDGDLFYLELTTRVSLEDEETVLSELSARIDPRSPATARMRVSLATRHLIRGDSARALDILSTEPPRGSPREIERWYDTRGMALANRGDLESVNRHYEQWHRAGGEPAELKARYALTLSIANLESPDRALVDLLGDALAEADGIASDELLEAVTARLILTLVASERQDEAIAVFHRYRKRFELSGFTDEELERSASHRLLASDQADNASGVIRYSIAHPPPGSELLISPQPSEPIDSDYEILEIPPSGVVEIARVLSTAPVRWVYRDAGQNVRASGTVHPVANAVLEVPISPRTPKKHRRTSLSRRTPDGRSRVFLMLLDCADWRLIQYLRTRGDLPTLDSLLREGFRAVLDSDPPLTAAALEALVWPDRRGGASFVGLVRQLGVELAGLAEVGVNPFDALSWILPEYRDLFDVVGSGERTAANLLFSHGGIRAGRHAEITGPHGQKRRISLSKSARDLNADEHARWPHLAAVRKERDAVHVRTIAAEFDIAAEMARNGEVDFLALRIEPLDILTHAHFAQMVRTGQDDGDRFLFDLYRYIDARLGETYELLDEDDIFIVMSDHGIRTAMEHSRHALFVARGSRVPVGRAPGRPGLSGVPSVIVDLLGVQTDWPRTGVAPWARNAGPSAENSDDMTAG